MTTTDPEVDLIAGLPAGALRALLDEPGQATLPPAAYTDADVYTLERRAIFEREWWCVGRTDQLAEPGSYFTVDIIDEPLVITRDDDGAMHALSRTCAHRWMDVCAEPAGTTRFLECPYHTWRYDLTGRLVGAPHMHGTPGFDRASCGLAEFRIEEWQGFIMVNLDREAEALAPRLAPVDQMLAKYRLADWRSATTVEWGERRVNWKIAVENAVENYHHLGIHRYTLEPISPGRLSYTELRANDVYTVLHMPIVGTDGAARDRAREYGLPPAPWLSPQDFADSLVVAVYPTHLFAVSPDSVFWYQAMPSAVDRLTIRLHALVPPGTLEHPDVDQLLAGWRAGIELIQSEDDHVYRGVMAGVRSSAAAPGALSTLESGVAEFSRFVAARLLERA